MGIVNYTYNRSTSGGEIITHLINSTDGQGLNFANGALLQLAYAAGGVFGTADFSIEFIIDQSSANSNNKILYTSGGSNEFQITSETGSSKIELTFDSTDYDFSYDMSADYGSPVHYVMTFDRSALATLYKDGNSVATVDISGSSGVNLDNTGTAAGYLGGVSNYGVTGVFYRWRTWKKLLSAAEVTACYENASVPIVDQWTNCVTDLDFAFANPEMSLQIQSRSGAGDATASAGISQVTPIEQLNAKAIAVGSSPQTPADNSLIVTGSLCTTQINSAGHISVDGTDAGAGGQSVISATAIPANANGPILELKKSRNSAGIVASDDLGQIDFKGHNGSSYQTTSQIIATAQGTFSGSSLPSQLDFYTTAASSTTPVSRLTIDSAGRVNISDATNRVLGPAGASNLQISGTGAMQLGMLRSANNAGGPHLNLTKSRGAAPGTFAIVQDGDSLGKLSFGADDGADYASLGAYIEGKVAGTPGANDMPGSLVLATTADGATDPTPRLTIDAAGNAGLNTDTPNESSFSGDCRVLSVQGSAANGFGALELITPDVTSSNRLGEIRFVNLDGSASTPAAYAGIRSIRDGADGNANLSFWTGASGSIAERVVISSAGFATFANGIAVTTGGIQFPATQSASADPNNLDDYEEGAFVPTISAASGTVTTSSASGTYTKIGRLVNATFDITITTNGTGAGTLNATLPFTGIAQNSYAHGREVTAVGFALTGTVGATVVNWVKTSNDLYPAADGYRLKGSAVYQAA